MPDLQYTPGGCIVVHVRKLKLGLQYMLGSCEKGVANAPSGHTCAMVSCKCLSYTKSTMLQAQATEVAKKLSEDAVARHFQVETESLQMAAAERLFGGDQDTKGFV